jgi:hypothetical protein
VERRGIGRISFLLLVVALSAILAVIFRDHLAFLVGSLSSQGSRVHLLCKINHKALLKAGREILQQAPKPTTRTPDGWSVVDLKPIPENMRLPQVISDLRPSSIMVHSYGYLVIVLHGGMDHFGVHIYPEDFNSPSRFFKYGDRKIIDGLWYLDEDYRFKDYDKRIDALLKKNKYREEP